MPATKKKTETAPAPTKNTKTIAKKTPPADILSADQAAVARSIADATKALHALRAALPALVSLTAEERSVSIGKLREDEPDAITSVLDTVDAHPQHFTALAERDAGTDPTKVETTPSRDALAKAALLAPFAYELEDFATEVDDTLLALNGAAREFSIAAYGIGRAVAKQDKQVKRTLAKALDFYSAIPRTSRRGKTPPTK